MVKYVTKDKVQATDTIKGFSGHYTVGALYLANSTQVSICYFNISLFGFEQRLPTLQQHLTQAMLLLHLIIDSMSNFKGAVYPMQIYNFISHSVRCADSNSEGPMCVRKAVLDI